MMNESHEDKRLSELLHTWKLQGSLPPRFQEQVWRRIAAGEARESHSHWTALSRWFEGLFARPAFATAYVALLLLAGLGAGLWQAHGQALQSDTLLRARYVQMVDPYQMPRN